VTEARNGAVDLRRDILLILIVTGRGEDPDVKRFKGTGFMLGNVFVTCHHCVSEPLEEEDRYVVAVPIEWVDAAPGREWPGPYGIATLRGIEQDPTGLDLATAKLPFESASLTLSGQGLSVAMDISTYGYPLTQDLPHPAGAGRSLTVTGRYLKGYCTITYLNDVPDYPQTPSYELDIPAPRGLSGAPLIGSGSTGGMEVVGVVYGTKDTGTVEEFSRVDEASGERVPELQRITTFAVAHTFDSLYNLSGRATEGMPLGEYLQSLEPEQAPTQREEGDVAEESGGTKVLTDEELAKVNEWLSSKDVSMRCESCGRNDWAPGPVVRAAGLDLAERTRSLDHHSISMFQMLCNNCGYIRHYSAGMIGLL
jgi:hypothetical protein